MSDMAMDGRHDGHPDAAGTKGATTMALILWVVVVLALAYGLFNTVKTATDLFAG
jgi:hypothetical protein